MTATNRAGATDAQVVEALALLKGADSVELKVTVPETDQQSTVAALEMDSLDAQIRHVYFFDTPDLKLSNGGVVVRARRVQGKREDTVVKLRPVIPSELPLRIRTSPGFGVEVDMMPGGFVCSASLKGKAAADVRAVATGKHRLSRLFSKAQRAFYADHAPDGLALDDLTVFGPIFVLKLKFVPKDLGRRLVAEMWFYPDNSRLLELSTKCLPSEAFQVVAELRAALSKRGVDLGGEQETKTRKALLYFSERLKAG
jgi:hypothetical protein